MQNGFTWSKLSLQQRYNYGIFAIISTLTVVIVWLASQNTNNQNHFEQIRINEVAEARKKDSIEILYWKNRADVAETKLFNYLVTSDKKYNELVQKAQELKKVVDAKK